MERSKYPLTECIGRPIRVLYIRQSIAFLIDDILILALLFGLARTDLLFSFLLPSCPCSDRFSEFRVCRDRFTLTPTNVDAIS